MTGIKQAKPSDSEANREGLVPDPEEADPSRSGPTGHLGSWLVGQLSPRANCHDAGCEHCIMRHLLKDCSIQQSVKLTIDSRSCPGRCFMLGHESIF